MDILKNKKKINGYLNITLHTHLPFVNHIENDNYIEEQWLYEAISESYIPLLKYFNKLIDEHVIFRITMSFTPPLIEMLKNKIQQEKYIRYLEKHIELCKKETERTKNNEQENNLAVFYYKKYCEDLYFFKDIYKCDIIEQFKKLQNLGVIEIIAGCATHGYIPMLYTNEKNIEVQIKYGIMTYQKYFGRKPKGIWLSECGYVPEVEKYLNLYNIEYFYVEMHGLIYADPIPIYGIYAPIVTKSNIVVFGRDVSSSMKIWSNTTGYPGDANYRDFGRDIGYDLDYEYMRPYMTYDGIRIPTGIKYYSVSDKSLNKKHYNLINAKNMAESHAYDFMQFTINEIKQAKNNMNGKLPIVTSMQDTELYGHWWYEGPYWLYILIKKIYYDQDEIEFIFPSEYIKKYPQIQVSNPNISSWGSGGSNAQWARCEPADIYIKLEIITQKMIKIAKKYKDEKDLLKIRVLNQCARELLLLQSSDWFFNLTCHRVEQYSRFRIDLHIDRFNILYNQLEKNQINEAILSEIENNDKIFDEINYKDYSN